MEEEVRRPGEPVQKQGAASPIMKSGVKRHVRGLTALISRTGALDEGHLGMSILAIGKLTGWVARQLENTG